MVGHAKCLLLMTRGGGGVKKTPKPAYVIHGCSLKYDCKFSLQQHAVFALLTLAELNYDMRAFFIIT
jgi:hypothetical protein